MSRLFIHLAMVLIMLTSITLVTSSGNDWVLRSLIYVEKSAYELWRSMSWPTTQGGSLVPKTKDGMITTIEEIFKGVNQLMQPLKITKDNKTWTIQVLIDVEVLDTNVLVKAAGNATHCPFSAEPCVWDIYLKQFQDWMNPMKFGMAMLFTGVGLYDRGYTRADDFCWRTGVSVVEMGKMKTLKQASKTITHEIGHLLGAEPDMYNPKCSTTAGIMQTGNLYEQSNKFSTCAEAGILRAIQVKDNWYEGNCMELRNFDKVATITGQYGSKVSEDDVCKKKFGQSSRLWRSKGFYGDTICTFLRCKSPGDSRVYKVYTPSGTICGKGKVCIDGKCKPSPSGDKTISDLCPFGDMPSYSHAGKHWSCANEVKNKRCTDDTSLHLCCQSCKNKQGQSQKKG